MKNGSLPPALVPFGLRKAVYRANSKRGIKTFSHFRVPIKTVSLKACEARFNAASKHAIELEQAWLARHRKGIEETAADKLAYVNALMDVENAHSRFLEELDKVKGTNTKSARDAISSGFKRLSIKAKKIEQEIREQEKN